MADSSKKAKQDIIDADDPGSLGKSKEDGVQRGEFEISSKFKTTMELFGFICFTVLALLYVQMSTELFEHYETNQSVRQSFTILEESLVDSSDRSFKGFWVWLVAF